ncbi:MAG: sigma-70 family RNA polymerase sigma factor, partial [Pseudomonadota bacterium]
RNQQISAALARLPPDQRHVVELKFFQHFTFEDIAGQLDISPNTAKTRLYSALRKLQQHEELRDAL